MANFRLAGLKQPRVVIVNGDSHASEGIDDGDYLVIDDFERTTVRPGNLIVIEVDDGKLNTRKWLSIRDEGYLQSLTDDADLLPECDVEIVGVVRFIDRIMDAP